MRNNTLFGLPPFALNALSVGVVLFIACLGIRVIRASDIALEVANTKLVTSSSADKLEALAVKLEEQAEIIEQKDEAYNDLSVIYQQSLKNKKGYGTLKGKIEAIETLPEVEDLEGIKAELEETENELSQLSL